MRAAARLILLPLLLLAACGGDEGSEGGGARSDPGEARFAAAIREAQRVEAGDFPAPAGRTLEKVASKRPAVSAGLATSVYTPGSNRLAIGVIDNEQRFVYGKTVVYLARKPDATAIGPIPAPADPLVVEPPFRSRGAADADSEVAAIYEARVDLPRAGRWFVLTATQVAGRTYGASAQIRVSRSDPIPSVGDRAPRVATDTLTSAGGDIEAIDTRVPPDDMHDTSFDEVVGEKPVALLFATPRLCQTRVCGPVVDIAAQLKKEYGDRMEFIHQEVYVDNVLQKGLRAPLRSFRLSTEPWLFTVSSDGRVAARLEGSFGNGAFERAIRAAL